MTRCGAKTCIGQACLQTYTYIDIFVCFVCRHTVILLVSLVSLAINFVREFAGSTFFLCFCSSTMRLRQGLHPLHAKVHSVCYTTYGLYMSGGLLRKTWYSPSEASFLHQITVLPWAYGLNALFDGGMKEDIEKNPVIALPHYFISRFENILVRSTCTPIDDVGAIFLTDRMPCENDTYWAPLALK